MIYRQYHYPFGRLVSRHNLVRPPCWDSASGEFKKSRLWVELTRQLRKEQPYCSVCRSTHRLGVHHRDGNYLNCKRSNLIVLCVRCHFAVHHQASFLYRWIHTEICSDPDCGMCAWHYDRDMWVFCSMRTPIVRPEREIAVALDVAA